MKREVWADEQVMAKVNAAFIPVTIDVDNPNAAETMRRYGVGATPTTIIISATTFAVMGTRGATFLSCLA